MNKKTKNQPFLFLLLSLLFSSLLFSCVSAPPTGPNTALGTSGRGAQLSIYVNIDHVTEPIASLQSSCQRVEIFNGAEWLDITGLQSISDHRNIASKQFFLATDSLPPGSYTSIRLTGFSYTLTTASEKTDIQKLEDPQEIPFYSPLNLMKDDSQVIFLSMQKLSTLAPGPSSQLITIIIFQDIPLQKDLAYVACPDINSVFYIRTDTNRVAGAIGVSGGPNYIVGRRGTNFLYVLTKQDSSIKRIELSSHRLTDSIKIPMVSEPTYMALDDQSENAFIVDERSGYISVIDLQSGNMLERMRVGEKPNYATYLTDQNSIAVSSGNSQEVFILDSSSLRTLDTILTSRNPAGLFFGDNTLYIAEKGSGTVKAYDINTGSIQQRHVGVAPTRLTLTNSRLYVANRTDRNLQVLLPGRLSYIKSYPLSGQPVEMSDIANRRWLYIGTDTNKIDIIDLTSSSFIGTIPLASRPVGIANVN